MRLVAQFSAQAMVYFYHTPYYVYHGLEFDSHDVIMHDRKRTLSTKLMLAFDDTHIEKHLHAAASEEFPAKVSVWHPVRHRTHKLDIHMERVRKAGGNIENLCGLGWNFIRIERKAISDRLSELKGGLRDYQ